MAYLIEYLAERLCVYFFGGGRVGAFRKSINLIITFLVSGVWHGAGFNFIAWGLLQGIYQVVGESTYGFRTRFKKAIGVEENSLSEKIYRIVITFHLTTLGWIFFRSESFMAAVQYIKQMFHAGDWWKLFNGSLYQFGVSEQLCFVLLINIGVVFLVDYIKMKQLVDIRKKILESHIILRWTICFVIIFNIILFGAYGSGYDMSGFLYGGF